MTSNSKKQSRQKKQKTEEDETLVVQKNRYTLQTCINSFEQSNDHTQIMHKM